MCCQVVVGASHRGAVVRIDNGTVMRLATPANNDFLGSPGSKLDPETAATLRTEAIQQPVRHLRKTNSLHPCLLPQLTRRSSENPRVLNWASIAALLETSKGNPPSQSTQS